MIVIVYKHKDHLELAQALKYALQEFEVIIQNKLTKKMYSHVHIFVDLHHYKREVMPKNFFVYNYQQLPCGRWKKFECIKDKLAKAIGIWDYSYKNMEMTQARLNLQSTFVPFGYSPTFDFSIRSGVEGGVAGGVAKVGVRDIDVLFIGEVSLRRTRIMNNLKKHGIKVVWPNRVDGVDKGKIVNRAKIVLNLHKHGDLDILEIARISFYLSNRSVVVSEKSIDEKLMMDFGDHLIYGSASEIPTICSQLLADEELLNLKRMKSYEWFKNDFNYRDQIPIDQIRDLVTSKSLEN